MFTTRLKLTAKLTLAFGALAAIVLIVAALSLRAISIEHHNFVSYVEQSNARLTLARNMLDAANARAIRARNLVLVASPADRDAEHAAIGKAHTAVGRTLAELKEAIGRSSTVDPRERTLFGAIEAVEARYGPLALSIVQQAMAGQNEKAVERMNAECRPLLAQLVAAAEAYAAYGAEQAAAEVRSGEASFAFNRLLMLGTAGASLLLAAGLAVVLTRAVTGPIRQAVQVAERVAAGDLSADIVVKTHDETGALLTALKAMNGSLVDIVHRVRQSSDSIATGSAQIAVGNNDLSRRTEEQAASLQQTAASMEQMNTTVTTSADTARQASQLAGAASQTAERGGTLVNAVVSTMQQIADSSRRIGDINSVIDGIAFQTNILALNAAVEAARAGEQGRGFAVVASEVRSLAQRSAEAAREIKSLIGASASKVEAGSKVVADAGETMREIVVQVRKVAELITEISSAAAEQTGGIGQVNLAVTQLDRATQQNAALVEESAAAAESLKQQASQLIEAVGVFKLRGA